MTTFPVEIRGKEIEGHKLYNNKNLEDTYIFEKLTVS